MNRPPAANDDTVGSLSEGCVADDEHGALYIGEELGGIWRDSAEPDGGSDRTLVDAVGPGRNLAADVEGLALATRGDGGGLPRRREPG